MFVPVAEAQLLDTWHVRGMRGTGTHHFAVDNVFVPAERTVLSATAPLLEDRPLYRIPRTLLFASGDASVAFGMARACLNTFMDLAGAKVPRAMPALLRDQSMVQVMIGQCEAWLRTGKAFLNEAVREIWTAACANTHHARSPGEPAPGHHARHPPGRADRRRRLQRGRRHRRLRGQRPAALLPGHPRDHPAHAEPALALRAGRAVLAGAADRREPVVARSASHQPRCSFRPRSSAAIRSRTG